MSEIQIDRQRVQQVVKVSVEATAREVRGLHPLEAIIGFSEVVGRAISAQGVTPPAHSELIKIATKHITDTVKASYSAAGKNATQIKP